MNSLTKRLFSGCVLCIFSTITLAAEPASTIKVWPGKAPNESQQIAPERVRISVPPAKPQKEITNVSEPALVVFPAPRSNNTGVSVIILPGGGFGSLKMDYEGEDFATWANTIGVTGIVLKYRVPQRQGLPRHQPALQDLQRSISLVRSQAKELGIDPNKVGVAGFSAGAIAAVYAQTAFEKRAYEAIDDIDKVSCKPDFSLLIYPGTILQNGKLFEDIKVTKDTPPTFITVSHADNTMNAVQFYIALKEAAVPTEMHIYASGVHGFGMFPSDEPHGTWTARLTEWMKFQKLTTPAAKP